MNAVRHVGSFVGVASRALNLGKFVGVGKFLDGGVTVGATQSAVYAGRMLAGIDRDAFAAAGRHARLAVAGEAGFILLQRFRLGTKLSGHKRADEDKQEAQSPDDIGCASRSFQQVRSPMLTSTSFPSRSGSWVSLRQLPEPRGMRNSHW